MSGLLLPLLLSLHLWVGPAWAEDPAPPPPPWYVGLPVGQVSLEAPEGGLPRENLEPLLRLSQGETYDPALVRQDVALLVRAGAFAAVEVDAEPWFSVDEQGEPLPAVRVVYRVYPPARIERIDLDGVRGAARRMVEASHGLSRGEAFFPRRDGSAAERRIQQALVAAGWPDAKVQVVTQRQVENRVRLVIRVDEGQPRLLDEIALAPGLPLEEKQVRRALASAGLRRGHRITDEASRSGRNATRDLLARRGYLDPRVNLLFTERQGQGEVLAVLGDAGDRIEVAATGRGAPSTGRLRDILGLQSGTRLTEGTVEDAQTALRRWLQGRGFLEAHVTATVERAGKDTLLVLAVDRGPRHRLTEIAVEGAEGLPASTVIAGLREAAPTSLGRKILVLDELSAATRAVQELYRGQGYLDARVAVGQASKGPVRWHLPLQWAVSLRLLVVVTEGPRSTLQALEIEGGGSTEVERVALARESLVGEPYRPAALDALRQELVTGLRNQGYLSADVGVDLARQEEQARAMLRVSPGQQARLRSVIIQGNRRTRRSVIARELAMEVGQPISPSGIEETRRRLYELDLFRVVNMDLVGEDDTARDLILQVEERAPVLLELSGGIATDRGVQARARAAHRNLGGLGHTISLLGQAGYAWSGDEWRLDLLAPVWKAALRYEAPNLPTRGQRLVAELLLNETVQEPTYRTSDSGASIGVRSRLGSHSEAFLSYATRLRTLEDVDPGALVQGDPWLSVLGLSEPPLTELDLRLAHRVVSGPSLALVFDQRDDPVDPRRGWRASGLLTVVDGLFTDAASLKAEARTEELVPLGPVLLALGAAGGLGWAQGGGHTLAVEDRFSLGGSGSLRGFRPQTVGPANRVPRPSVAFPDQLGPFVQGTALTATPTHWVETGGDALVSGTVELRMPLAVLGLSSFQDTWLVGFADVGRVSFLSSSVQPTSRAEGLDPAARVGTGGGVRLSTAIGPISFLLGVNPAPLSERAEQRLVVHFSLGDL